MRNTLLFRRSMNKQRLLARTLLIALMLMPAIAIAQQRTGHAVQFGVQVNGLLGATSSEFSQLPGVANCIGSLGAPTLFDGGSGGGFSGSVLIGLTPVGQEEGFLSHLGGELAVGYASASTTFEVDERIGQAIDPAGKIMPVFSRYTVDTKVSELRLEPMARYYLGKLPLTIGIGARLGFLMAATYEQKETIASPSAATFEDGSKERNNTSGDLAETSGLQVGIKLGLAYDLMLAQTITVRPEIAGMLSLTSPVQGITWNPHELRLGVAILFTPALQQSTPLQQER
jgi:hypothetical protein